MKTIKPESMIDIYNVRYPLRGLPNRLRGVLAVQPGWSGGHKGHQYAIRSTYTGGHRLYILIADQWRDASLRDISPQEIRDIVAWAQSCQQ